MFWRKRKGSSNTDCHVCQLCETVNELGAKICKSCYYELDKSSREQAQSIDSAVSSTLLNELMDENFDFESTNEQAVSVLTIDEVAIDISEYPEENTDFFFISSEGPTFANTELETNDGKNVVDEIAPSAPLPPESMNNKTRFEEDLDLEPEINVESEFEGKSENHIIQNSQTGLKNIQNGTIWPWVALEPWDSRDLHREIVSAMEAAKRGDRNSAAEILDRIGPHLGDSVEVIFHVGAILRSIGRSTQLQQMLNAAKIKYPENENVDTAIANLGN